MIKTLLLALRWAGVFGLQVDGGGGGGGGSPPPANQTVTNTNIPDWMRPQTERMLGKAEAVVDTPYQTYGGDRVAGATDLQNKAAASTGSMSAGPAAFSQGVQAYMNPYQQQNIDVQKREAGRMSDIQGQGQQAQATQAGAFGGYRDAIERSERERNLAQQQGDIQAKGNKEGFDMAAGQFRAGNDQQLGIDKQQAALGMQQQQTEQSGLDKAYQDFQMQQQDPYKKVGFMSDILHGVPGTSAASTMYTAPPSQGSQLAGLGTAAAGLLMKKEGGEIKGYADGGLAGIAPEEHQMRAMLEKMSDAQLQQVAKARPNDPDVAQEMQRRAALRSGGAGIAALPAAQEEYADGGIIGFDVGGPVEDEYGYLPGEGIMDRLGRRASGWGEAVKQGLRAVANPGKQEPANPNYGNEGRAEAAPTALGNEAKHSVATPVSAAAVDAYKTKTNTEPKPAGIASLRTAGSKRTRGGQAPAAVADSSIADTGFKADTYATIDSRVRDAARADNEETDKAFAPAKERLAQREADIKKRGDGALADSLISAGLGMMASKSPHALQGIGEGGLKGLETYKSAKDAQEKAMEANDNSRMLLEQAHRAERSGNLQRATQLYGQARAEKMAATQFAQHAQQMSDTREYQRGSLAIAQQKANQDGEWHRMRVDMAKNPQKYELATLKQQAALIESELKNPMLQAMDPERYATLMQQKATIQQALSAQPGGATITGNTPNLRGWGQPQPVH